MIGIFDSGVGGLTIVKEVFKYLPEYQVIYFGDTARLPYGTKGKNFLLEYSEKIVKWLLDNNAKIIIIACNTSSAWATDFLKKKFDNKPIFEMITPVIEKILENKDIKKIGVIGTPATIKSDVYQKKLQSKNASLKVYSKACPLLVPLIEEGWIKKKETRSIIRKYLEPIKQKQIDALVLGCTHYPLLKETIKEIIGSGVEIINPAESLAKKVRLYLNNNPNIKKTIEKGEDHQFFFSDRPYHLKKISNLALDREIEAKIKNPFR